MQFRDLKSQYQKLKPEIDQAVTQVMKDSNFILGSQVTDLEKQLANYVGVKYCITCANGTDALTLALKAWNIGIGDAIFVPDFTFFASGETVAYEGATPIFVDVDEDSFNMSPTSLELAIQEVLREGKHTPKVILAVDLFGQPAEYNKLIEIANRYGLYLLEDGAQGFGGGIGDKHACSFGDIATTSFFPAKPLGCYGDGGAIFTNNKEWADLIRSLRIHGKGTNKYDNIHIGMNSRLDTLQAAILLVKLKAFKEYELEAVNHVARIYNEELGETEQLQMRIKIPLIQERNYSSWAQYSILLNNEEERNELQVFLREREIPSMIYYPIPMHQQTAFSDIKCKVVDLSISEGLCKRVLSLPIHPYLRLEEQMLVINTVKQFLK